MPPEAIIGWSYGLVQVYLIYILALEAFRVMNEPTYYTGYLFFMEIY